MSIDTSLSICNISRHQYYYVQTNETRGKKAAKTTERVLYAQTSQVSNTDVMAVVLALRSVPDTNTGYRSICRQLQLKGYKINPKKMYRLFKENSLLQAKPSRLNKVYVKRRRVKSLRPLEVLEMDIKYVWIEKDRCHSYILTVIDTFTRSVLGWHVAKIINRYSVKKLWEDIINNHLQPADLLNKALEVQVRNDNDKRFSANLVQEFFKENKLNQVFTHPYTPQENGHIESFHALLSKSLNKHVFNKLSDLEIHLSLFYLHYNHSRSHTSTAYLPPMKFWSLWNADNTLFEKKEKPSGKIVIRCTQPLYKLSEIISQMEASCPEYDGSMPEGVRKGVGPEHQSNYQPINHRLLHLATANL